MRGDDSDADAAFVVALGRQVSVDVAVARRAAIDRRMARPPANASARYRAARLVWFAEVVHRRDLDGVLLAHHADDQAETALLAIVRGHGVVGLPGIRAEQHFRCVHRMFAVQSDDADGNATNDTIDSAESRSSDARPLRIARPLLGVRRDALRDYLRAIRQPWREDASNASPAYRRNVARQLLNANPALKPMLLNLQTASATLRDVLNEAAPPLDESFPVEALRRAAPLAERAVFRWLIARGSPPDRVSQSVCRRLIDQALNPAAGPRQHYPGGLLVRRRQKRIDVMPPATASTVNATSS